MSRIGVFGGTFNPPHLGHLRLAQAAKAQCALDTVLIMPANIPPHKQAHDLVASNERLALCRLTFSDDGFVVSDLELRRTGKSYTVDTMHALRDAFPGDELFLIIGSDMLLSFDRWYRWQEILSLCTLIVLSRDDDISPDTLRVYANETLGLTEGESYHVLLLEPMELSSTMIRETIRQGGDASDYLTAQATAYIKEKGLYQ